MSLKNEVGHPLFKVYTETYADGMEFKETYILAADSFTELGEIMDEWFDINETDAFKVEIYENVTELKDLGE